MNLINRIEHTAIAELVPYAGNARTHSEDQVAQIAASIKEFGFNNPVLIDKDNGIIAGHGRVMAAGKLGLHSVPTVTLDHLNDAERRAYILADNRLALNAGWDEAILASELQRLESEIDLDLLGFDDDELTALLNSQELEPMTDEDAVPDAPENPATVEGDVWLLGRHRLMCGDSTSIDAINILMGDKTPDLIYTDPPYGMNAVSKSSVLKKNYDGDIIGDDNPDTAKECFALTQSLYPQSKNVWFGANYYSSVLPDSECWIVWDKNNGGSDQTDCELAWADFRSVVRQFTLASEKTNRVHPTQKPVDLFSWVLQKFKVTAVIVADFFGGSGSTLIGVEKHGSTCCVMEFDQKFCDVIIKRWQDYTGQQATHEVSGKTFDEVANVSEEIRASTAA